MKRLACALLGPLLVSACIDSPTPAGPETIPGADSRVAASNGQQIPGEYIVVFRPTVANARAQTAQLAALHGAAVRFVYEHAIKGFAGPMSAAAATALAGNASVDFVEADQTLTVDATQTNPPSWGLDRIDQHNLPLDDAFTYDASGAGVTAYIVDSGIRTTHNDFAGRATGGFTSINDGNGTNDCYGHGTHVAGTVGAATFGVAKGIDLVAVRVLDCSGLGTVSGAIAGVDWITQQAQTNNVLPAVANLSLGAPVSSSFDQAVQNSINAGVVYVVSAGNDAVSACNQSPARLGPALTIAASDSQDRRASFSNFGSCVDLFAPGVSITSTSIASNSATEVRSGTSMASPHVAGAAAQYLERNPGASPGAVASALTSNATSGTISNPGSGTPNRLLYTGFIGGPPPGGTAVVTVLDATTAAVDYQWTVQPGARYVLDLRAADGSQWTDPSVVPSDPAVGVTTSPFRFTLDRQGSDLQLRARLFQMGGGLVFDIPITVPRL